MLLPFFVFSFVSVSSFGFALLRGCCCRWDRIFAPIGDIQKISQNHTKSNIVFKSDTTVETSFHADNTTKLLVILTMYGYPRMQHVRNRGFTILNPPKIEDPQQQLYTFWVGRRMADDEELLYATKKSTNTLAATAHKLNIDIQFEYYITYVSVAVDVSVFFSPFLFSSLSQAGDVCRSVAKKEKKTNLSYFIGTLRSSRRRRPCQYTTNQMSQFLFISFLFCLSFSFSACLPNSSFLRFVCALPMLITDHPTIPPLLHVHKITVTAVKECWCHISHGDSAHIRGFGLWCKYNIANGENINLWLSTR